MGGASGLREKEANKKKMKNIMNGERNEVCQNGIVRTAITLRRIVAYVHRHVGPESPVSFCPPFILQSICYLTAQKYFLQQVDKLAKF